MRGRRTLLAAVLAGLLTMAAACDDATVDPDAPAADDPAQDMPREEDPLLEDDDQG